MPNLGDGAKRPLRDAPAGSRVLRDREKALAAGCDAYDTKPIKMRRLLGKIKNLMEK
ncbi:hypothetical protein [Scytonema sp. HK-05]|uniref:hypothetical protein n=1 Tax=Scytonema sp. HK-05 TaxID=1137095 RepID=UPI000AAE341C|nr:hypothetical protein [Scytonema sp. HK-05]